MTLVNHSIYWFGQPSPAQLLPMPMSGSVVQARAQSPEPAELSPSCQSHCQGFTGPRAWALIFGSLRLQLQALGVYTDKFSVIFSDEGLKKILTMLFHS